MERAVKVLTAGAVCAALWAVILLGAGGIRLLQALQMTQALYSRSQAVYRAVFEPSRTGSISNPLLLAREKISSLSSHSSSSPSFAQVLRSLGHICSAGSLDIRIDILRLNSDGLACTGSAHDMNTVLAFRRAWEDMGMNAVVDNTQSVSGIGYRFDMRVRRQ